MVHGKKPYVAWNKTEVLNFGSLRHWERQGYWAYIVWETWKLLWAVFFRKRFPCVLIIAFLFALPETKLKPTPFLG